MLRDYFSDLKPFGKRESEWKAFQGIRKDYSEEQIAACFEYLVRKGVPASGARCHSPMGFLAKGIGQVWGEVRAGQGIVRAFLESDAGKASLLEDEEVRAERDFQLRHAAFVSAYPEVETQENIIDRYADRFPMLSRNGAALRRLAIIGWWAERQGNDKSA